MRGKLTAAQTVKWQRRPIDELIQADDNVDDENNCRSLLYCVERLICSGIRLKVN